MAGNFRSGRKPTHKTQIDAKDRPQMPDSLGEDGRKLWLAIIERAKHLTRDDEPLCLACCESWERYRKAKSFADDDPIDKEIRIAVNQYLAQWRTTMERLGLDPLGRVRVGARVDRKEQSPLEEFGIVG